MRKPKPGSLIQGTDQPSELIQALLGAVRRYAQDVYEAYVIMPFGPIPAWVYDDGPECEWWDSEDARNLLDNLISTLDDEAPDGYYFGRHPNEPDNYGFWPIQ